MSAGAVADARAHIWLCADDYGISPAVNAAIRDLVARERLNATSVMVVAPSFSPTEAAALKELNAERQRVAIGLHVTLTAPFRPHVDDFRPLQQGHFLPVGEMLRAAMLRRLQPEPLQAEVAHQLQTFIDAFGQPPDFIDGHQHVQLFPQVRDAVLRIAAEHAPQAWLRQCGRPAGVRGRFADRKGLLLDILSVRFRRRASRLGVRTNPVFAGTYDFRPDADFSALFPTFLEGMRADGLIMCHPGFVDAELTRLDPLTTLREREYAYFAGDSFPKALAERHLTLT